MKTLRKISIISSILLISLIVWSAAPGGGGSDPKCKAGGPGATSCELEINIGIGSQRCSVTCGPGFYACCYTDITGLTVTCTCKSGGGSGTS